jgi:CheY-like chemotaxis protein
VGIDAEFLPFLFQRFTQSGTPGNRAHGGLGLGLAIVKHLVELHGGTITAHSAGRGHGALLTAKLRVAHEEADAAPVIERAVLNEVNPARRLQGRDILVVDDSIDTAEMLTIVLTDEGARVRTANSYEEALVEIERAWPDQLVSDIGMPGKDGYDLITRVRELEQAAGRPRLPAIALTAFARPQDRERALAAGFDQHLGKPLQPHLLIQALV